MTAQTSMIFYTIHQILEYSCSAKATVHSVSIIIYHVVVNIITIVHTSLVS